MTDAAVLLVARLVDSMALWALLLAFGALICQVTLKILSGNFNELAGVTRHWLHRADLKMSLQVTSTHRWAKALIRALDDS